MPAIYELDQQNGRVLTTLSDRLTDADLLAHLDALHQDERFRSDLDQLIDATGVTEVDVSSHTIRLLARTCRFGYGSRRALVGANDLLYGLWRMYGALRSEGDEIAVFRKRDEAQRWLTAHPSA